jgi:hypothetical protein
MAHGDTQRAFAEVAARDGVEFVAQWVPWLNQRGHLGLPDDEGDIEERTRALQRARGTLEDIYVALGGDLSALAAGRLTALPGDFIHEPTGTLVEVDESQHFTSFRLMTLDLYPEDVPLGFDLDFYKRRCREWQRQSDGYYRAKAARGFGVGGRQKQRAYYDALRDLAAPAMGRPPLVRVEAADSDPADAYYRHRDELLRVLSTA